jgi:hypothetical protein
MRWKDDYVYLIKKDQERIVLPVFQGTATDVNGID